MYCSTKTRRRAANSSSEDVCFVLSNRVRKVWFMACPSRKGALRLDRKQVTLVSALMPGKQVVSAAYVVLINDLLIPRYHAHRVAIPKLEREALSRLPPVALI